MLFICGSLRKDSYNRKLMTAAMKIAQELGAEVSEALIADIPLYNGDMDVPGSWPVVAQTFFDQIKSAEAVCIVSPEYNFSIPGGLKNALDWASRGEDAWKNTAIALMGVSIGPIGTARGQMHLRQALLGTGTTWVVPQPQLCISADMLDDQKTAERVRQLLENLIAAAGRVR